MKIRILKGTKKECSTKYGALEEIKEVFHKFGGSEETKQDTSNMNQNSKRSGNLNGFIKNVYIA
jgi:hypothetical protein